MTYYTVAEQIETRPGTTELHITPIKLSYGYINTEKYHPLFNDINDARAYKNKLLGRYSVVEMQVQGTEIDL